MQSVGRPPVTLIPLKAKGGKYYAQVTVPKEDRKFFKGRKQLRASTGTADKALAKRLLHDKAEELYQKLDEAKPDRVKVLEDRLFQLYVAPRPTNLEEYVEDDEVREWMKGELSAELEHLQTNEIRLSELFERYLATNPLGKARSTQECERSTRDFIEHNGDLLLSDITKGVGYRYAEKLGEKYANETVVKKIGYVRRALSWAERQEIITDNPLNSLELESYGKKKKSYVPLSDDELRRLFAIRDMPLHLRVLLSLLLTTGMRLDEAALLDWSDLKAESDINYYDLTHRNETVKNIGSQRKVPAPSALEDLFSEYAKSQMTEGIPPNGPVFPQ